MYESFLDDPLGSSRWWTEDERDRLLPSPSNQRDDQEEVFGSGDPD